MLDSTSGDNDGNADRLPEGEKENSLDTEEFGHWTEGLEIVVDAYPEHGETVKTQANADVVDDTDV